MKQTFTPSEEAEVTHYRRVATGELIDSASFDKALFARVPCRGSRPITGLSAWYCSAEKCAVRTVELQNSETPHVRCPACGGALEFRGHLEVVTLIPAKTPTTNATATIPSAVWDALYHLYHGKNPAWPSKAKEDFYGRELVCTPFGGCYGPAGWVACVNGSPPRGTVLIVGSRFDGGPILVYFDGTRSRRLNDHGEAAAVFRDFHRRFLDGAARADPVLFH
jgi:hypothetical protein